MFIYYFCYFNNIIRFWVCYNVEYQSTIRARLSFETIKEGLCIHVEYEEDYYHGREYVYCLVYDEEINKVIEVDLFDELIHTNIDVGDTIVYVVDCNYTDADFLNVINKEDRWKK